MTIRYTHAEDDPIEVPHELYSYDHDPDWTRTVVDAAAEAAAAAVAAYLAPTTVAELDAIATDLSVTWTGTPTKSEKVLQLIAALYAAI